MIHAAHIKAVRRKKKENKYDSAFRTSSMRFCAASNCASTTSAVDCALLLIFWSKKRLQLAKKRFTRGNGLSLVSSLSSSAHQMPMRQRRPVKSNPICPFYFSSCPRECSLSKASGIHLHAAVLPVSSYSNFRGSCKLLSRARASRRDRGSRRDPRSVSPPRAAPRGARRRRRCPACAWSRAPSATRR